MQRNSPVSRDSWAAAGVTQDEVARAAGVTRPAVVNVLAGRGQNDNVLETARRLLE